MPAPKPVDRAFFDQDAEGLARALIGVTLLVDGCGGPIVETEAYDIDDPAAHSYRGLTAANAVLFGSSGHIYVYRIYGLHWCLNFVAGAPGSAVLIRATEPAQGVTTMMARRGMSDMRRLCAGPGRLCQALAVNRTVNDAPFDRPPFVLLQRSSEPEIAVGPRIGITKNVGQPWRFGLAGSPFLSRPFAVTQPRRP